MKRMTMVNTRELIGRRIIRFKANRFKDPIEGRYGHNPVIVLDDGSELHFQVEETGTDYGVVVWRKGR